jgi:hypothetical protein
MPILISGGIGLAESVVGLVNKGKLKKEAAQLEANRPKYKIQKEFGQDVSLMESELGKGMSARAERAYNAATDRQLSSSLSAILKGGGNVNSIGDLYAAGETGRQNLAIMQDNLRLNQINNLVAARQRMAQEEQTAWQVNEYAPFKDKATALGMERQEADKQIWAGVNTLGSSVMQFGQDKKEQNMWDKYLNVLSNNKKTPTSALGASSSGVSGALAGISGGRVSGGFAPAATGALAGANAGIVPMGVFPEIKTESQSFFYDLL